MLPQIDTHPPLHEPSILICFRQSAYNILLCRDRRVFRLFGARIARPQARNLRVLVGIAKKRDGLTCRCHALCVAGPFGRRRDDAMQCGAKDVVRPSREKITSIHDDRAGLGESVSDTNLIG